MRVKGIVLVVLVPLLVACSAGKPPPAGPAEAAAETRIPDHETYLRNVTEIRATSVSVILPASYEAEVEVSGLSSGWRGEDGKRIWEGGGDAKLRILSLLVLCRELTVTLVERQTEPEVLITASGNVTMAHSVRGVGSYVEGLDLIVIRNERCLER